MKTLNTESKDKLFEICKVMAKDKEDGLAKNTFAIIMIMDVLNDKAGVDSLTEIIDMPTVIPEEHKPFMKSLIK